MMASIESWLLSGAAKLFLRLAIATIRMMRWLYNRGLISEGATDQFFRCAKHFEHQADRLMTGKIRHD
jgi:hypothetical protein